MTFDHWARRLAGEKNVPTFVQPQPEDEGYYRRPITEAVIGGNGKTNGQKRIVGFEPVAYFMKDGVLTGWRGSRRMRPDEVTDEGLWSWVVRHPVKKEWLVAVVRGEPWPDSTGDIYAAASGHPQPILSGNDFLPKRADPEKVLDKAMGADADAQEALAVGLGHNRPPEVEPHVEYGEAIENAIRAAKDLNVNDEASAAIVLGAQNRIAELRLAATKQGKSLYQPIYAQYKAIMGRWTPMIEKAETWEKVLDKRYKTWRADELRKANELARKAAEEKLAIEEANERAAQRAIANGNPEPPPAVPEAAPEPMPRLR